MSTKCWEVQIDPKQTFEALGLAAPEELGKAHWRTVPAPLTTYRDGPAEKRITCVSRVQTEWSLKLCTR